MKSSGLVYYATKHKNLGQVYTGLIFFAQYKDLKINRVIFTHFPPRNKRKSNYIERLLHTCFHPTNPVTPLSRIFFEKLIVPQPVYKKNSVILWNLMVHYCFHNYTPVLSEGEPDESSPRHPILFFICTIYYLAFYT